MAQPLDPGAVQDDGGAMSVPDLDSGAGAAAGSAGLPGGADLGQVDDSGNAFHGVPGDSGADMGAAAGTAGLPGGADLGQVDDSGNAFHGVPGDTGVAADQPEGNPFLNDVSAGATDPGQQPEGNHDIPDLDPNSAEGGGFLGGLFGGGKDAANSAEQAHNLPDEHAGAADTGQQPEGTHDIPDLDPNSAEGGGFLGGLFGGGKDAANSAEQAHNLPDEHAGATDPGQSGEHGSFPILDDLAVAQAVNPQVGHVAHFSSHEGVINDPASIVHNISTPHQTIMDPHGMPEPGAEIGDTGHYGGENPQAFLAAEHQAAAATHNESQPVHEGGEDNSHVAYLHPDPAQESHTTESFEHHPM
jgi:hypothetical protein